ncbi:MAG: ABC transporter ATP-binding protein [Actinomycetota bacterium]
MLAARNLEVVYDDVVLALRGVSLDVPDGKIVALLGSNGAGKTTLLRALTGLLDIHDGEVTKGRVTLDDKPLHRASPESIVRKGVRQVLEGRRVFVELSVEENLKVGAHTARAAMEANLEHVFDLFPLLAERRGKTAGYLSGGEQQMLAIGRALMTNPGLLIMDEPSEGLAPVVVEQLGERLQDLKRSSLSMLLVEQNYSLALKLADILFVMENGRVVFAGGPEELDTSEDVKRRYLGVGI